jgi:shikimate 5-dehydrogenase
MAAARARGLATMNGRAKFEAQALAAFQLWTKRGRRGEG